MTIDKPTPDWADEKAERIVKRWDSPRPMIAQALREEREQIRRETRIKTLEEARDAIALASGYQPWQGVIQRLIDAEQK